MSYKADDIKRQAAGRWVSILESVCGLSAEQLNPRVHGPCPQCGGTDRFRALDDVAETGALFCNQCHNGETSPRSGDGLAAVQWLLGCTFQETLQRVADFVGSHQNRHSSAGPAKPAAKPKAEHGRKPVKAIEHGFLKFLEGKGRDKLSLLAERLNVSVESLRALGVGFNPDGNVWTFPERNADGDVAGICRRFQDGEKKMTFGHKHGLYFADNWRDLAGPVLIVEGASDTAAAFTLGLCAIGRPSKDVPRDVLPELVELLKSIPAERGVIVVGENDQDLQHDDFRWPGKEGAERTARELTEALGRRIPWALPPNGTKDLRNWLKANPEATGAEFVDSLEIGQGAAEQKNETPRVDFEIIDSRTFAESDFRVKWAIENVMAVNQPQLYSGPSKTLKTSILADQVLSLAAAVPFLGKFDVPQSMRVLFLSSESGTATLQETANRICQAKGIELAELGDRLFWGFRPPQLTDAQHIATLTDFVLKNKIEVLAIDPAYLSMNLPGNDAANQFAVGAVLMTLTTLQAETGCTPILATHTRMHMQTGIMPTLDHIAGAGFGQWARQWFLLNRREEFDPDEPGTHRLLMTFGGSAGHCGAYGLDIEEGRAADGRFWKVDLNSLSQIREDRESEKEARKREQSDRTYENRRVTILKAIKRFPNGETKTRIKETASLSSQNFGAVFQDLLDSQEIEHCQFDRGELRKDGTVKTYFGYRFVDPASRLKPDSRTQADSPGLCPIQSG